jgi:hypothetical protein
VTQALRGRAFCGDPAFRLELEAWVAAIWAEKDQQIETLLQAA